MTITGRLTADAAVNMTKTERKVVNFSIAVNDSYRVKGSAERSKVVSFYNCAYWISEKLAAYLKKGTLVELTGRIYVMPYVSKDGLPKASLNCHVSNVKFLASAKELTVIGKAAEEASGSQADGDDMPF